MRNRNNASWSIWSTLLSHSLKVWLPFLHHTSLLDNSERQPYFRWTTIETPLPSSRLASCSLFSSTTCDDMFLRCRAKHVCLFSIFAQVSREEILNSLPRHLTRWSMANNSWCLERRRRRRLHFQIAYRQSPSSSKTERNYPLRIYRYSYLS